MLLVVRGVLAVACVACPARQDAPKTDAPPKQDPPAPSNPPQPNPTPTAPQPANGQPATKPTVKPASRPRPPAANVDIPDVDQYRGGQSAAVTHAADLFTLDLSGVDVTADPVLVVDDVAITRADVDRTLALMLGANEIEQFVTGTVFQRVKKQLADRGEKVPDSPVTDDEVKKKIDSDFELFGQLQGMTKQDREKQIREFGWDRYFELQRRQLEFDRFFLPDPPKEWAEHQKAETKRLDAEQKQKRAAAEKEEADKAKQEGREPKKLPLDPPAVPEGSVDFVPKVTWDLLEPNMATAIRNQFYLRGQPVIPMYRTQLVKTIRAKLLESMEVRLGRSDEPGVAVVADGQPLLVKDLLALIGAHADDRMRRAALLELVSLRAADARLTHDHALLSPADGEAAFAAFVKRNSGSFITPEMVVERGYGFASLWHFREYYRRRKSYENLVTSTISDEKLSAHYDKAARLFSENGVVVAHVLFVPGTDRASSRPAVDALLAEVGGGKAFSVVAREKGKFPDNADVHAGSIAPLSKNRLRNALHDSEYVSFLTGYSFADEVFYSAKERQILGPVWRDVEPEATGWYVVQPDRFFTTTTPRPPLSDPKARERALEDLAASTFPRYVNESLARSKIENPAAKH
jgi:hypothetical protein